MITDFTKFDLTQIVISQNNKVEVHNFWCFKFYLWPTDKLLLIIYGSGVNLVHRPHNVVRAEYQQVPDRY